MFWDDVPFALRARFMLDNVMELSDDFTEAYSPAEHPGFAAFRALLVDLYATPDAFQGGDDLQRFHALSYTTQVFFPAIAQTGEADGAGDTLHVRKPDFKKAYKKPGNTPFDVLPQFGVTFSYTKGGKPASTYAACDAFAVRFPAGSGIAAALKCIAPNLPGVDHLREYADAPVMLCKADFDRLVLGHSALRGEICLLRPDIVRATGEGAPVYTDIVHRAQALGLNTSASIQRYANPTWNINFLRKKQLRLKTIWCEGRNFVHVPVPFGKAEAVIQNRQAMPLRVREAIGRFGCVQCGRCQKGAKVQFLTVDGITICSGHGESSTLFLGLETLQDVAAVFDIIASLD